MFSLIHVRGAERLNQNERRLVGPTGGFQRVVAIVRRYKSGCEVAEAVGRVRREMQRFWSLLVWGVHGIFQSRACPRVQPQPVVILDTQIRKVRCGGIVLYVMDKVLLSLGGAMSDPSGEKKGLKYLQRGN